MAADNGHGAKEHLHRRLERRLGLFAILTTVAISIGGIVEIAPMFTAKAGPPPLAGVTPYTPLELAGRDLYIREGCYVCHSQMIRPMRAELLRYGEWTRAGEYAYDRPFQLGSRRTGPDLQRVGGKYPDAWHYEHMRDPRSTSPGSIMPAYPWLLERTYSLQDVHASVVAMQKLGVPYVDGTEENVARHAMAQARGIAASLAGMQIQAEPDREIIALIAYLQRLGVDGKNALNPQPQPARMGPPPRQEGDPAADPHAAMRQEAAAQSGAAPAETQPNAAAKTSPAATTGGAR